jgi:Flp pilus assembly protein TadG
MDQKPIAVVVPYRHQTPQTSGVAENDKRERGASVVEAAIVLPVLFLLIMGLFEFALIYSAYQSMVGAVREGARVAVAPNPSASYALPGSADVATAVCSKLQAGMFGTGGVSACNAAAIGAVSCPPSGSKPSGLTADNVYYNASCAYAVPEGGTETYVVVAVRRSLQLLWGWKIPLTAYAVMRSEAN